MVINDHTIRVEFYNDKATGNFRVDLAELVKSAGNKIKNPNPPYAGYITELPIPKARKLVKQLVKWSDYPDRLFIYEYLRDHNNKIMSHEDAESAIAAEKSKPYIG